ncbi:hypothetical protein ACOI1C_09025 [Bacillus sp. DJP31]|uniref:hypothetical protein n=1 Tax=Bacillus sp. DJP31 TaxID=3409789 RepID=UPI003BB7CE98
MSIDSGLRFIEFSELLSHDVLLTEVRGTYQDSNNNQVSFGFLNPEKLQTQEFISSFENEIVNRVEELNQQHNTAFSIETLTIELFIFEDEKEKIDRYENELKSKKKDLKLKKLIKRKDKNYLMYLRSKKRRPIRKEKRIFNKSILLSQL